MFFFHIEFIKRVRYTDKLIARLCRAFYNFIQRVY